MKSHIYLDIETVPTESSRLIDYIGQSIKAPGNMKKPETIAKWEAEEKQNAILDAVQSSSFDGCFNNIICIGFAFDDEPTQSLYVQDVKNEAEMLRKFYDALLEKHNGFLAGKTFIGHNINGFDLRVIRHRSIILGVQPPPNIPFDAKPWDKNPFDTMVQWDAKNSPKLEKLAIAMGIQGKSMDGSKVYPLWLAQEEKTIREYCEADVDLVRKVYKRMEYLDPASFETLDTDDSPKRLNLF